MCLTSLRISHALFVSALFFILAVQLVPADACLAQSRAMAAAPAPAPAPYLHGGEFSSSYSEADPDTHPITRLDSVLEFSRRYQAMSSKGRALQLEEYLGEFPHSPALMLAIGRAFLYHTEYYQPGSAAPSSCADTLNFAFADSALHWMHLAKRADPSIRDYQFDLPVSNWLGQAYSAKIFDCMMAHQAAQIRKLLIDAKLDSAIAPIQFQVADELFSELPKDAVLLISSFESSDDNAILPMLYRQVVDRTRLDVSPICRWLLGDSSYVFVVHHGLEGIVRRVEATPMHSHIIPATDSSVLEFLDTVFTPAPLRRHILQLSGIEQPQQQEFSMGTSYESNLLRTFRWNRPVFSTRGIGAGFCAKLMHGFTYEVLPVDDSITEELDGRYSSDSTIAVMFHSPRIGPILRAGNHDHFGTLVPMLANMYSTNAVKDTARLIDLFDNVWNSYTSKDTLLIEPLLHLAQPLIPSHVSPEVAHWADTTIRSRFRSAILQLRPSLSHISNFDYQIEAQLGNCEYLHQIYAYAAYARTVDTLSGEYAGVAESLEADSRAAGCTWAPPILNLSLLSTGVFNRDLPSNEDRIYQLGDTVVAIISADVSANQKVKPVTVTWFNKKTSQYVHTDASVALEPYKTEPIRLANGRILDSESKTGAKVSLVLTNALPGGDYEVDVVYNGEVAESRTFSISESQDE